MLYFVPSFLHYIWLRVLLLSLQMQYCSALFCNDHVYPTLVARKVLHVPSSRLTHFQSISSLFTFTPTCPQNLLLAKLIRTGFNGPSIVKNIESDLRNVFSMPFYRHPVHFRGPAHKMDNFATCLGLLHDLFSILMPKMHSLSFALSLRYVILHLAPTTFRIGMIVQLLAISFTQRIKD